MTTRHTEAYARIATGGQPAKQPIAFKEPVTDALLDRMVQAIVDEVDPEQVILFGSRGRGDAREFGYRPDRG